MPSNLSAMALHAIIGSAECDSDALTLVAAELGGARNVVDAICERNQSGDSALAVSASRGYLATTRLLLEKLAEGSAMQEMLARGNSKGRTPLHLVSTGGDHYETALELLGASEVPSELVASKDDRGKMPVEVALDSGRVRTAHTILTMGKRTMEISWPSRVQQVPNHMQKGITTLGFISVLHALGFWRDGHVSNEQVADRHARNLDWVDGSNACGYDLQKAIELKVKEKGVETASMCEIMMENSHPAIGDIDDFISHTQGEPLEQTLLAMMLHDAKAGKEKRYFLDYTGLRQAQNDFTLLAVEETIRTAGATTMIVAPIHKPQVLDRVFCIFELGRTLRHDIVLETIYLPGADQEFMRLLEDDYGLTCEAIGRVDIQAAKIRKGKEQSKTKIVKTIQDDVGIPETNNSISKTIIRSTLEHLAVSDAIFRDDDGFLPPGRIKAALRFFAEFLPRISDEKAALHRVFRHQSSSFCNYTLLHWAAEFGSAAEVRSLLRLADGDREALVLQSSARETPAELARSLGQSRSEVAALLREAAWRSETAGVAALLRRVPWCCSDVAALLRGRRVRAEAKARSEGKQVAIAWQGDGKPEVVLSLPAGGQEMIPNGAVLEVFKLDNCSALVRHRNTTEGIVRARDLKMRFSDLARPAVGRHVTVLVEDTEFQGMPGEIVEDDQSSVPYLVRFQSNKKSWYRECELDAS